jgi:hypothetical protein
MTPRGSPADRARVALLLARSRDAAYSALLALREAAPSTHAARAALSAFLREPTARRAMVWPALEACRESLGAMDQALDRALIAALSRSPLPSLANELAACHSDVERAARALALAWQHLCPPRARAAASLVDLLRGHALGPARVVVYRHLVSQGVDVRAALADDTTLPASERLEVLCALAARRADAGQLRPVPWPTTTTPTTSTAPASAADALFPPLARALADWAAHVTHPRQLFYWFRRRAGLDAADERAGYLHALERVARWPLSPEVLAQFELERQGTPAPLPARPLAHGRYECTRCGDGRVVASDRRPVDPEDPAQGTELEFRCPECALRFFSVWELATLEAAAAPVPVAWV